MANIRLHNGKHLTLDDRIKIETGANSGDSLKVIADSIHKDPTTVKREILTHRKPEEPLSMYPVDCAYFRTCKLKTKATRECLSKSCVSYTAFTCKRRDKSPGVCNKCSQTSQCHYLRLKYKASAAEEEYTQNLHDSRAGVNLTEEEAKQYGAIIAPLLKQGQSPEHVIHSHEKELPFCERTLYNYIHLGVFKCVDVNAMDLRNATSRKPRKRWKLKKSVNVQYRKRKDNAYLKGRTHSDYMAYRSKHPEVTRYVEMDTVYNRVSGPFLLTLKFMPYQCQIAVYHEKKTAQSTVDALHLLEKTMGKETFQKYFGLILTDRGSEFAAADEIEHSEDKTVRCRVFYCDAMQSCQKASCENNHHKIRYVLPKKRKFEDLGMVSQEAANFMCSHINSLKLESIEHKSPLDLIQECAPDLFEFLKKWGLKVIAPDKVYLKPDLLTRVFKEENETSEQQEKAPAAQVPD